MTHTFKQDILFDDQTILQTILGADHWDGTLVMDNNDCTNNIYKPKDADNANTEKSTRTAL